MRKLGRFKASLCIIMSVLLLSYNFIYADYSSLTPQEKQTVTKAFKQAKFYKYYEALAKGTDTVNILHIRRLEQRHKADNVVVTTYAITLEMNINNKKFRRETEWYSESEILINKSNRWAFLKDSAWKVGIGLIIGILVGSQIRK